MAAVATKNLEYIVLNIRRKRSEDLFIAPAFY